MQDVVGANQSKSEQPAGTNDNPCDYVYETAIQRQSYLEL